MNNKKDNYTEWYEEFKKLYKEVIGQDPLPVNCYSSENDAYSRMDELLDIRHGL